MVSAPLTVIGLALAIGCAPPPGPAAPRAPAAGGDDIALYRDVAVVRQHVALDLPATPTTVRARLAAGVRSEQVVVIDRGGVTIRSLRGVPAPDDSRDDAPTELALDVTAPHAGRYDVVLAYTTDRLRWDAAYTMTTTPARDRAVLRGALAIRNTSGLVLGASVRVIDAELGTWRNRTAEQPSSPSPDAPAGLELGTIALPRGETRVELIAAPEPRAMRSVLVFDPIGTGLDNASPAPLRDPAVGAHTASTAIAESFEVERDGRRVAGLPAGPVRLLERRGDGTLAVLGQARLFDPGTRVADIDTIAVGTADGVTARRERREMSLDDEDKRLVEEFAIVIDNRRAQPVSVLLREHMYRGQNWTLAYTSTAAAKEGPQQIALRTEVAPHATQRVIYVVVYTW